MSSYTVSYTMWNNALAYEVGDIDFCELTAINESVAESHQRNVKIKLDRNVHANARRHYLNKYHYKQLSVCWTSDVSSRV